MQLSELTYELPSLSSLWNQFYPVLVFGIAIAIYGIIIWHFYRNLAKKNIIKLDLSKYEHTKFSGLKKLIGFIAYLLKFGIIFPLISFIWFLVLAIMLFLLAKSQEMQAIIFVAMGVVIAVRITAYYKEDLARDLAKMLPLALLGIALIDPRFFSIELFFKRIGLIMTLIPTALNFIIFIMLMEIALKILNVLKVIFLGESKEETK